MKLKILILVLIASSNITFGQRTTQKKSYPANLDKIENIKSSYTGCTLGPCYTWWSIALKGNDELLMQSGAHHPAGSRSRHFRIGTWKISGDTLKLNIIPKSLDTDFMRTEYRIVNLYNCDLLLPIDSPEIWDTVLKELQEKYEQSETCQWLRGEQNSGRRNKEDTERVISREFEYFVRDEYSTDKKLLVKKNKWN